MAQNTSTDIESAICHHVVRIALWSMARIGHGMFFFLIFDKKLYGTDRPCNYFCFILIKKNIYKIEIKKI